MRSGMIPTEAQEQEALFRWAQWLSGKYPELKLMHHIPNGGSRNPVEAARLKAQGVLAGIPDIFLPAARGEYHGLYIEMKRQKGGRLSEDQKIMIDALRHQGYRVVVCRGCEDAMNVIKSYLEGDE